MHHLAEPEWAAIVAHRLHQRWHRAAPDQLEDIARELWRDERLRELEPVEAAADWLAPLEHR